jgi:WD40 repeat protein
MEIKSLLKNSVLNNKYICVNSSETELVVVNEDNIIVWDLDNKTPTIYNSNKHIIGVGYLNGESWWSALSITGHITVPFMIKHDYLSIDVPVDIVGTHFVGNGNGILVQTPYKLILHNKNKTISLTETLPIKLACIDFDGLNIAYITTDNTIIVKNININYKIVLKKQVDIQALAIYNDILACVDNEYLKVFNHIKTIYEIPIDKYGNINVLKFSINGEYIIAGFDKGYLVVLNIITGLVIFKEKVFYGKVVDLYMSNNIFIAISDTSESIPIWTLS